VKFAWIKENRSSFGVRQMCAALNVSVAGYYAWLVRTPGVRAQHREQLLREIGQVHQDSRQLYGSPRIHRKLLAQGRQVSENTVAKLMRSAGIRSKIKRRFLPRTTDSKHAHPIADNLLQQRFEAEAPNRRWVTDITYVETAEGWLYVAAILDLFSRKIVGWSMAEHLRTDLVRDALQMAVTRRRPGQGLWHHSDRGVQYASDDYQQLLASHGCVCSMSRTGNCYDNAVMESFWKTLKTELVYQTRYVTRTQARQSVFEYIEVYYNRQRLHSALNYATPESFEAALN
jgi:transposase InsO family protein